MKIRVDGECIRASTVVQTATIPPFLLCSLLHSSQLYKNDRNSVMDRNIPYFFWFKHYSMCIMLHIIRAHCIFTLLSQ